MRNAGLTVAITALCFGCSSGEAGRPAPSNGDAGAQAQLPSSSGSRRPDSAPWPWRLSDEAAAGAGACYGTRLDEVAARIRKDFAVVGGITAFRSSALTAT